MKDISRRQFLKQTTAAGFTVTLNSLLGLSLISCRSKKHKSPNLIIFFPDQMRGQALGFLGEEPVITPNLDRFAQESVVFTQAVSNYPVCSPFRAMLMTGQYPHTNGVLSNCNSKSAPFKYELKQTARCWSDVLKENGYSLGYIGKWHLDSPIKPYVDSANNKGDIAWNEWCRPQRRHGFDFWYAYGTYDQHLKPMYWSTFDNRGEPSFVDQWGPEHEADLAIKFINNEGGIYRDSEKPFALVVSTNPPHMPYDQVPQKYVDMYQKFNIEDLCRRPDIPKAGTKWGDYYRENIRNYYAMITGVDEHFGRIIDALKGSTLEEDTIVVFASDHGNCLGIHDQISKNNHFEESMRIPLIIRWPGKINPRHDDLLLSVPDIYPTLLDLMGFSKDIPPEVQGISFSDLLRTGEGRRPSSQIYLWVPLGQPEWGRRGVRTHQFTLVLSNMPDQPVEAEFFDRNNDPYQMKNIAQTSPEIIAQLIREELEPWLKKNKDPWWENSKNRMNQF